MILCDVAREDASAILGDLREMGIDHDGSIAIETVDTAPSTPPRGGRGRGRLALGRSGVGGGRQRSSESAELSVSFLAFMIISMLIAAVGVALGNPVLVIGAMVVGRSSGRSPASAWR